VEGAKSQELAPRLSDWRRRSRHSCQPHQLNTAEVAVFKWLCCYNDLGAKRGPANPTICMKRFLLIAIFVASILLGIIFYQRIFSTEETPVEKTNTSNTETVKPIQEVNETIKKGELDCDNCWLAPVDKEHFLSAIYAPSVEALGISGGGSMVPEAAQALRGLFEAADTDGIDMYVRSAYRSYSTQEITFEKWVQEEIAKGLNREDAELKANTYSAKPGASEHQLGTTADLLCTSCGFEDSEANDAVWRWLADNSEKFGFVLSYPEGREGETGYIYEPWHWRYIGITNAKSFNSQDELTLNKWLGG